MAEAVNHTLWFTNHRATKKQPPVANPNNPARWPIDLKHVQVSWDKSYQAGKLFGDIHSFCNMWQRKASSSKRTIIHQGAIQIHVWFGGFKSAHPKLLQPLGIHAIVYHQFQGRPVRKGLISLDRISHSRGVPAWQCFQPLDAAINAQKPQNAKRLGNTQTARLWKCHRNLGARYWWMIGVPNASRLSGISCEPMVSPFLTCLNPFSLLSAQPWFSLSVPEFQSLIYDISLRKSKRKPKCKNCSGNNGMIKSRAIWVQGVHDEYQHTKKRSKPPELNW